MPLEAIIGVIATSQVGGDSKNACVTALSAVEEKPTGEPTKSTLDEAPESGGGALEDVGKGISKGLKSLFGN